MEHRGCQAGKGSQAHRAALAHLGPLVHGDHLVIQAPPVRLDPWGRRDLRESL